MNEVGEFRLLSPPVFQNSYSIPFIRKNVYKQYSSRFAQNLELCIYILYYITIQPIIPIIIYFI